MVRVSGKGFESGDDIGGLFAGADHESELQRRWKIRIPAARDERNADRAVFARL